MSTTKERSYSTQPCSCRKRGRDDNVGAEIVGDVVVGSETIETTTKVPRLTRHNEGCVPLVPSAPSPTHVPTPTPHPNTRTEMGS